jgi:hypothetical protein
MQELLDRLTSKAGLSAEQATSSVGVIKEFVKEKFPMLAGAVDNIFAGQAPGADATEAPLAAAAVAEAPKEEGMLDKISDLIPGATGQKIEDFAKNAADKAEDLFDGLKDKVSGLMK